MKKSCDPSNATQTEVAATLGITTRQLRNYAQEGCPRKKNGRYCMADVIRWLISKKSGSNGTVESPKLEGYRDIRTKLAQLEYDEKCGKLVSHEDVVRCWGGRIKMFRDACLFLIDRLPPLLVNLSRNETKNILQDELEGMLNQFAQKGRFTPETNEEVSVK